jgi:DHA2 family methylenomycin A resistance protein-like MFS transporter
MPAATTAVVEAAPEGRAGLAAGVVNAARQVGGVVGIALLGALVSGTGAAFVSGLRVAVMLAGAAFLLGAVITAFTVRRTVRT